MLKESQNRIKSMSLVHEKLCHSVNLADIDLGDYIKSLANSLFQSYGTKGLPSSPEIAKELKGKGSGLKGRNDIRRLSLRGA
jgi:two-component sensor histidine kinase